MHMIICQIEILPVRAYLPCSCVLFSFLASQSFPLRGILQWRLILCGSQTHDCRERPSFDHDYTSFIRNLPKEVLMSNGPLVL